MDYILANATVFVHGKFMKSNVFIANGMIHEMVPTAHLRQIVPFMI